jgi:DNA replication and repair protein RecF
MRLRVLELDEFRAFRKLQLPISPGGFRAVGTNASGKSTILEAIAMLATTRSPRTSAEREIAHWSSGADLNIPPYARVRGEYERRDGPHEIEIGITTGSGGSGPLKKHIRQNGRTVRAVDVVGQLKTVLFSPEDVDLIAGSPAHRRRYLDVMFSQASHGYLRALSRFSRVLEQRNSLLRSFARARIGPASPRPAQELAFWDAELTATAADVLALRVAGVAALGAQARRHYEALTGSAQLDLVYMPRHVSIPAAEQAAGWQSPSQYLRQSIAATIESALVASRNDDLQRGVTGIGPHRDDLLVTGAGVDLGRYGSRGQQRLAVIAIKLAELDLLEEAAGEPPLLLLDDVLSELDATHRGRLIGAIAEKAVQLCITGTDLKDLGAGQVSNLPLLLVEAGSVRYASAP